jgi:hypothetical protein
MEIIEIKNILYLFTKKKLRKTIKKINKFIFISISSSIQPGKFIYFLYPFILLQNTNQI